MVQRPRNHFLARTRFPHDYYGRIRGGDLLDSVEYIFHRFALTDDIFKVVFQLDFVLKVGAFSFQPVFQLLDLRISAAEHYFGLFSGGDVSIAGPDA